MSDGGLDHPELGEAGRAVVGGFRLERILTVDAQRLPELHDHVRQDGGGEE